MTGIYTIGFKIWIRPFGDSPAAPQFCAVSLAPAFCGMLKDITTAALSDNLIDASIAPAPSLAAMGTGYVGLFNVKNLPRGLNTVQSILERYLLTPETQIAFKDHSGAAVAWQHYAGPSQMAFGDVMDQLTTFANGAIEAWSKLKPAS